MNFATTELVAFEDWPKVAAGSAGSVVFGTAISSDLLAKVREVATQISGDWDVVVVPQGEAGEILWNGMPLAVATLAAEVRPECVVVVRDFSRLKRSVSGSLWEAIAACDPSSVIVTERVEIASLAGHWPELAPRSRRLGETVETHIANQGGDDATGIVIRAGLLLLFDDLDGSHELAQSVEGVGRLKLGDYWHAIVHRREPDYFNAKYWFRRVGAHPVFFEIGPLASQILDRCRGADAAGWKKKLTIGGWSPVCFVDLCESIEKDSASPLNLAARQIQWVEMLLLLRFCLRNQAS